MVGTMMDGVDQRRVVRSHGTKGRWHKTKLEALEYPTMLAMLDGKSFFIFNRTPYVCSMCGGATSTKNGHLLSMKLTPKKISPNIRIT
jgi:hypothetical protein